MLTVGTRYGHWISLDAMCRHYKFTMRRAFGLIALGQASLSKPTVYEHQRTELLSNGMWRVVHIPVPGKDRPLPRPSQFIGKVRP